MAQKDRPIQAPKEKTPQPFVIQVIFLPFTLVSHLIRGLLIALVIAVLIEWLGLYFFWPNEPHHASEMFTYEFNTLGDQFKSTIGSFSPIQLLTEIVTSAYHFIFDSWLIHTIQSWIHSESGNSFGNLIRQLLISTKIYSEGAGYIVLTMIMRVVVFLLALPWFLLCGLTGIVNGLIEREIRKAEGGIEHAFIHHNARKHMPLAVMLTWIIYLSLPFAVHPSLILIPGGILFGFLVYVTSWTFKKYL